jgi:hypothetical protein
VDPTISPATVTGGTGGDDCTLTLTMGDQALHFPATGLTDVEGVAVDADTVPTAIKDAHSELTYELSQDSSVEESGGQGSNIKKVKADVVDIEFFLPTGGVNGSGSQRFPTVVQELIRPFLEASAISTPYAAGTDVESSFDSADGYGLTEGYP